MPSYEIMSPFCQEGKKKARHIKKRGSTSARFPDKTIEFRSPNPRRMGHLMRLFHPFPPRAGERATRSDRPCSKSIRESRRAIRLMVSGYAMHAASGRPGSPGYAMHAASGRPGSPGYAMHAASGRPGCPGYAMHAASGRPDSSRSSFGDQSGRRNCIIHPNHENFTIRLWRNME
jgi:hypothetical protein